MQDRLQASVWLPTQRCRDIRQVLCAMGARSPCMGPGPDWSSPNPLRVRAGLAVPYTSVRAPKLCRICQICRRSSTPTGGRTLELVGGVARNQSTTCREQEPGREPACHGARPDRRIPHAWRATIQKQHSLSIHSQAKSEEWRDSVRIRIPAGSASRQPRCVASRVPP